MKHIELIVTSTAYKWSLRDESVSEKLICTPCVLLSCPVHDIVIKPCIRGRPSFSFTSNKLFAGCLSGRERIRGASSINPATASPSVLDDVIGLNVEGKGSNSPKGVPWRMTFPRRFIDIRRDASATESGDASGTPYSPIIRAAASKAVIGAAPRPRFAVWISPASLNARATWSTDPLKRPSRSASMSTSAGK